MLLTPRPDSKASPKIAHMPLRGRTRRIDSYKAKRQPRSKKRVMKHHPQPSHKERTNSRETEVQATTAKQNNSPGARNGQRRPVRCAPGARDQQRNTAPGAAAEEEPTTEEQKSTKRRMAGSKEPTICHTQENPSAAKGRDTYQSGAGSGY